MEREREKKGKMANSCPEKKVGGIERKGGGGGAGGGGVGGSIAAAAASSWCLRIREAEALFGIGCDRSYPNRE